MNVTLLSARLCHIPLHTDALLLRMQLSDLESPYPLSVLSTFRAGSATVE